MYYKITSELYGDDGTLISRSVDEAKGLPNAEEYRKSSEFMQTFDIFEEKVIVLDGQVREQMQKNYLDTVLKKTNHPEKNAK